jgi:hypothetical protein
MTAPERIYLQGAAGAPDCEDPNSGVTWCWHQIDDTDVEYVRVDIAARATAEQSALMVWSGSMPESNGKTNFTAILHRGDLSNGFTIDRSEYPDRVRYEADRVRWLIGEIDKEPWILDYDADKHSGYVSPIRALKSQQDAAIESQRSEKSND